ncbi:MAG: M48 family metalloprotease [Elusimicrobiota bacterium]|nr:M48 family metalloprotease [Elusimicrobiota bacterium]
MRAIGRVALCWALLLPGPAAAQRPAIRVRAAPAPTAVSTLPLGVSFSRLTPSVRLDSPAAPTLAETPPLLTAPGPAGSLPLIMPRVAASPGVAPADAPVRGWSADAPALARPVSDADAAVEAAGFDEPAESPSAERASPGALSGGWVARRVAETVRSWSARSTPASAMLEGFTEIPSRRAGLGPARPQPQPRRRVVPGPATLPARLGYAAAWAVLIGIGGALNLPADGVWPVLGALAGGPALSWALTRAVYRDAGRGMAVPEYRAITGDEQERVARDARRLADQSGIAHPELRPHPFLLAQAAVTGGPARWSLNYFAGLLEMPEDQRRAVIAHEVGHVVHRDTAWLAAQVTAAGVAPALALAAAVSQPWLAVLALPLGAAGALLIASFMRLAEYQADRRSAWAMGGGRPLADGFRAALRDGHAPESYYAPEPSGFMGRLLRLLAGLFKSHPPVPARVRALESYRGPVAP